MRHKKLTPIRGGSGGGGGGGGGKSVGFEGSPSAGEGLRCRWLKLFASPAVAEKSISSNDLDRRPACLRSSVRESRFFRVWIVLRTPATCATTLFAALRAARLMLSEERRRMPRWLRPGSSRRPALVAGTIDEYASSLA